jgi:hypothetical protein
MSESGGMSVNCLTAGATAAMNLTWDSDNKPQSADIDANGTADVNFQYVALYAIFLEPARSYSGGDPSENSRG